MFIYQYNIVLLPKNMRLKDEITQNWLPRYTGEKLENFGKYILLTNFRHYVDLFAQWHNVPVVGEDRAMPCATAGKITIIDFNMGSPNAATIMDLLKAIDPKAVLFLGKCGALKKNNLGDLILPIAEFVAKELPTTIFHQRCQHYQHLACKRQYLQVLGTMIWTIGLVQFTPQTEEFGSMTKILKLPSKT